MINSEAIYNESYPLDIDSILKRNHVNIIGKGTKVILFAHGFGCDQNSWKFISNSFIDDYKLILFDYVGSGKSDISQYDYHKYSTLEGYACDVIDIINALNLRNIIFIGHSVSSMIGMIAALQMPEVFDKLIFIGPSPKYLNEKEYFGGFETKEVEALFNFMAEDYTGWAKAMPPSVMGNLSRPELTDFLQESFEAMDPKIALAFAMTTFNCDHRDRLKEMKVPSLTVQSKDDIISPISTGEYIKENMPYNSLQLINATGHYPHISEPEETVLAIKAFINNQQKT
nr:alpha/beta hydrolase [Pedobacter sp. ASV2]